MAKSDKLLKKKLSWLCFPKRDELEANDLVIKTNYFNFKL